MDKYFIVRKKISVADAASLTLIFDTMHLSKNTEMYLYTPKGTIITGPITVSENIGIDRTWSSNNFPGSSVVVELRVPNAEIKDINLHISSILIGRKEVIKNTSLDSAAFGMFNSSSYCNVNMLCPQGSGWVNERKAICLIQTNSGEYGTGAMLTNTCNTNKPYVLTAWHNTNGRNPINWTYIFGWWSSTCTPNSANPTAILFNGANLRATYEPTDFSLLELLHTPASNSDITYLGWSRSTTPPVSSVGISHPAGDQMKIAFANSAATLDMIRANSNTAWRVLWDEGITEAGSSGSPLFDQISHKVVGQMYSVTQYCGSRTGGTNYGRFDLSWIGGGTAATGLGHWLNPINSSAMTTNTANISTLATPVTVSNVTLQGQTDICGQSTYTLNGAPTGSTVTWSMSNPSVASFTVSGSQAFVTPLVFGQSTILQATVTLPCASNPTTIVPILIRTFENIKLTPLEIATCYDDYYNIEYPRTVTVQYCPANGVVSWDVPSHFNNDYTISGNTLTLNSGPTYEIPNTNPLWISATVSSSAGSFSTHANFWTQSCNVFKLKTKIKSKSSNVIKTPEVNKSSIKVSPNPSFGEFRLELVNTGVISTIKEVIIKNKLGQLVYHKRYNSKRNNDYININGYPAGIYTVQVFTGKEYLTSFIVLTHK